MSATLLDALRGRIKAKTGTAAEVVAAAARDAAAGANVDLDGLQQALFELHQDDAYFGAAVELAERRRDARRRLDGLAAAKAKASKLQQQIDAEAARFDEIRKQHHEKLNSLNAQRVAAARAAEMGQEAKNFLLDVEHLPAVPLADEYREAVQAQEDARVAVSRIGTELREHNEKVKSEEGWVAQIKATLAEDHRADSDMPSKLENHELFLTRALRRQKETKQMLAEAEATLTAAEKRTAGLMARVASL
jgi:hypothetical protein